VGHQIMKKFFRLWKVADHYSSFSLAGH
jgi:hypothetical protein